MVTTAPPLTRESRRRRTPWPWIGFSLLAITAATILMTKAHGLNFFFDEWNFILERRDLTTTAVLQNHNGHLVALPVLAYLFLFHVFGLSSYTPYMLMAVGFEVLAGALLFAYLRRRVSSVLALGAVALVLLLGSAWQTLLWPFQIPYTGAVAAGIGALLFLDRDDRNGDVAAMVCVGVSLAFSGVGIAFLTGVALELAWRRDTWRRLWVPLVPAVLYLVWYLRYGESQAKSTNIHLVPSYVGEAASGATSALVGQAPAFGRYLVGALVVVVLLRLVFPGLTPRSAAVIAMPLVFWALQALSRGELHEPTASRYLYVGAVFIVLVCSQLLVDTRLPILVVVSAMLVGAWSIHENIDQLDAGAAGLRDTARFVDAETGAAQLLGDQLPAEFVIDSARAPVLTAGGYLAATRDLGSPGDSLAELRSAPESVRASADSVPLRAFARSGAVGSFAVGGAAPIVRASASIVTTDGPCATVTTRLDAPTTAEVANSPSQLLVVETTPGYPAEIRARSLGTGFDGPAVAAPAGSATSIRLPLWRAGTWSVQVVSGAPVRICQAAPK